jgi:hypothetical protein
LLEYIELDPPLAVDTYARQQQQYVLSQYAGAGNADYVLMRPHATIQTRQQLLSDGRHGIYRDGYRGW